MLSCCPGAKSGKGNETADVSTELIKLQIGPSLTAMVTKPVVGVVVGVPVELVSGAVEVFAAALGVDQDHDARATAILGIEVSGQGLEFADSVETECGVFAIVRAHVGVDNAVEKEVVRCAAHSIDV